MSRFDLSRRHLMAGLAATPAVLGRPAVAQTDAAAQRVQAALKEAKGTKLVLLGTGGGPVPGRARRMTSGDTAPSDAVAQLAKGADVLVHEAIDLPAVEAYVQRRLALGEPGTIADYMAHMKASHTPAEDAGRIAQQAGVRTLVLSHLVPADGVDDQTWRAAAAKHFSGEIIVGQDMMIV